MHNRFKIIITGKPFAKQRPRFSRSGNFVKTYTPKETVEYENLIKLCFAQQVNGWEATKNPVRMLIKSYFPIPKSTPKYKQKLMINEDYPHVKKPDWDNIGKIVTDALNQIAYYDDNQVFETTVKKYYSQNPRVEVFAEVIDND